MNEKEYKICIIDSHYIYDDSLNISEIKIINSEEQGKLIIKKFFKSSNIMKSCEEYM